MVNWQFAFRRDLRKECIFTIDPATARDLDDAMHCNKLPDGEEKTDSFQGFFRQTTVR